MDKYFGCHTRAEPLKAQVAKAICAKCVVREECRDEALTMPDLPTRGVIGGLNVAEIHRARRWRLYEDGRSDHVPDVKRPEWLPMTDATHGVEQVRTEYDPDESPDTRTHD